MKKKREGTNKSSVDSWPLRNVFQIIQKYSDISRDHCHGLNQSATRKTGPYFTIMSAYSVVQRYMRAVKLVSGRHSTECVSTALYARVHKRVRLERKSYRTVRPTRKRTTPEVRLMGSGGVSNPAGKKP